MEIMIDGLYRCSMDFKIFKIIFIGVFVLCFAGSCGLRVGEVYKDPVFSGTNLGCMNKLRGQFESYVQQNLQEGELGMLSRCLTTAFTIFKHHVWGEERGSYSPEELRNFFHEFFMQDNQISDELLRRLMVLKTALVGGNTDSLTLDEIDHIIQRIEIIGRIMADVYPYNHILFHRKHTSFEQLSESAKAIKKTVEEFSHRIFQKPYSLGSANLLLRDIGQMMDFSSDQNHFWLRGIRGFAPFILTSSGKKDVILPEEWPVLMGSITDILFLLLHVNTSIGAVSFSQKILHYSQSFEFFLNFLKERMTQKIITRSEVIRLVQNLKEENIIPEKIQYAGLERVVDSIFGKILFQKEGDFSFGKEEFARLENFYQEWSRRQKDIDSVVSDSHWQKKVSEKNEQTIAELSHFKPLYRGESAEINVYLTYPSLEEEESKYKNLSMYSLYWSAAKAVIAGYAGRPEYGLTEHEFGSLIKDFRGFISDLGGLKSGPLKEIQNYGRTEFIAGHLLLYETKGFYGSDGVFDSDGSRLEFISQREGTEFLALTGFIIKTLKDLSKGLNKICSDSISRACFVDNILTVIQSVSGTMPHLSEFLSSISAEEKERYAELLFSMSVVDPEQIETLEFLEPVHLRNLVFTLLYQEVTITRYDLNENTVLDKEELIEEGGSEENVFQLYDGLIKYFGVQLFCRDPQSFEGQIGFVYNYVIRHLVLPPRASDLGCFGKLNAYVVESGMQYLDLWGVQIDRIQLMKLALHLVQLMRTRSKQIMSSSCEIEKEEEGDSVFQQIIKACF